MARDVARPRLEIGGVVKREVLGFDGAPGERRADELRTGWRPSRRGRGEPNDNGGPAATQKLQNGCGTAYGFGAAG